VDDDLALGPRLAGAAHDLEEVFLMGVHALVLQQAEQMEAAPAGLPGIHEADPFRRLEELARGEAVVDALELLDDDAAGAHVEVPDLAGALVAGGQADGLAAGVEDRPGILRLVGRDVRRPGGRDRVALRLLVDAPSVADDQSHWSHRRLLPPRRDAGAAGLSELHLKESILPKSALQGKTKFFVRVANETSA